MSTVPLLLAGKALEKAIDKLVEDIFNHANAELKQTVRNWKAKANIGKLYHRAHTIRNVKTILQLEREVDLAEFYYPSTVTIGGRSVMVNDLQDFHYGGNILVRGTVGQGKSIFFRYLASRELTKGRSVPVFLELRRVKRERTLAEHIVDELAALGLNANNDVFTMLASLGRVVLFLDAFDEVAGDQRPAIIDEIEHLAKKHGNLRIMVTSRTGSGIESSAAFRVATLEPLGDGEYKDVIVRMIHEPEDADEIINGVEKSTGSIGNLLTTPLMVALLAVRYRLERTVPENIAAFYGDIFELLLLRHDKSKPGYRRERASDLGDSELRELFEAACFSTRKADAGTFTIVELRRFIKDASNEISIKCDAGLVLDDYISVTCLIVEEGGECKFIHKSLQEYHAAHFIKEQPDEAAKRFYSAMLTKWGFWRGELGFLATIDTYRFDKLFLLEDIRSAIGPSGGSHSFGADIASVCRIMDGMDIAGIGISDDENDLSRPIIYFASSGRWCLIDEEDRVFEWLEPLSANSAAAQFIKSHQRMLRTGGDHEFNVSIETAMQEPSLNAALAGGVRAIMQELRDELHATEERVAKVESRRRMFEF